MRKTSKINRFLPNDLLRKIVSQKTESEMLAGNWQKIVGKELADHCAPSSFQNDTLIVLVENSNWASKLRHVMPELIKKCRKQNDLASLEKIKIKIGFKSKVNTDYNNRNNTSQKKSRISKNAAAHILESAKHIEDEALRMSLEKLGGNIKDSK